MSTMFLMGTTVDMNTELNLKMSFNYIELLIQFCHVDTSKEYSYATEKRGMGCWMLKKQVLNNKKALFGLDTV